MTNNTIPHFVIKNKFQKKTGLYSDILTKDILEDICKRVTGCTEYTCDLVDEVNVGRLATIEYNGTITYVSLSDTGNLDARNSFFQSLTTALIRYYLEQKADKRICFYFLPLSGEYETSYFIFMYRLMVTAGFEFLNADNFLTQKIYPFTTVDDIIAARNINRSHNKSNNSTYITRSSNHLTQVYGKTYGASKKETTLLCIALSRVAPAQIELYEICEQNLSELPNPDLNVIRLLGINIIPTDLTLERNEFEKHNSLRSPRFIYNLLKRLGPKKCAFCGCEIPELVQGAHIWPVADIKNAPGLSIELKVTYATDGENGIWLCENHHKMFDENLLKIGLSGMVELKPELEEKSKEYILNTTPATQLSPIIFTAGFADYVQKRYGA